MTRVSTICHVYLLEGFDLHSFQLFMPDPACFLSEEEAKAFCRKHSTDTLFYRYKDLRVGVYCGGKK